MRLPKAIVRILLDDARQCASRRAPDFVLPGYLERWYVAPRNRFGNIYLHRIRADDRGPHLHDHRYANMSVILDGVLWEERNNYYHSRMLVPGNVTVRRASTAHRLWVLDGPVWTLWLTGPRVRNWGFWIDGVWVPWQEATPWRK